MSKTGGLPQEPSFHGPEHRLSTLWGALGTQAKLASLSGVRQARAGPNALSVLRAYRPHSQGSQGVCVSPP